MTDWNEGYTTEVAYTFGYYPELSPIRARMALLKAGLDPSGLADGSAACELGFGQGLSVNVHAAASGTPWCATDFNASQAAFAQELAQASGAALTGTRLVDEAFADFCQRTDLPDFNFIGLHGIWSWISDANRAVIVDFVRRKLRVGGVLYISYNTHPGWAAMAPMRDLMAEHAQVMGIPGKGISDRVDGALAFVDKLMASDPHYARSNPQVADRLKRLKTMNRNYLAHEYFNYDWQPQSFSRMAQWLAPAKLGFACSAHYQDHLPTLNFTSAQQALLQEQPSAMFRETVRDFLVNQQFRRDYWIKGPRKLSAPEQAKRQGAQRVMLLTEPEKVSMKVKCPVGEALLSDAIYTPVLAAMGDHKAHSISALWERLQKSGKAGAVNFGQLNEALLLLIGKGDAVAVQDEETIARAKPGAARLNQYLIDLAQYRTDMSYLASPVSGGAAMASRFEQLFIQGLRNQNAKTAPQASALAAFAWNILNAQGERIVKDSKPLQTMADNMAELTAQATVFVDTRLPMLQRLGVVD
jgi:SAM-dependent methyltransferase